MRAASLLLVVSSALAAFAFSVFHGPPAVGARHWAGSPLLAMTILAGMSGLVVLTAGPRGRLR